MFDIDSVPSSPCVEEINFNAREPCVSHAQVFVSRPRAARLPKTCRPARRHRNLVGAMMGRKWKARTKRDLMIEVWEHLDCESVGARELEEIMNAVRERFNGGAIESPAAIARLLADEGAELRHAEVLEADARWRTVDPYEPMLRNVLRFSDFDQAANSIRRLENLRKQLTRKKDEEGLRRVRETALRGKQRAQMIAANKSVAGSKRAEKEEIAQWFTIWLQTPEMFDDWVALRRNSKEFKKRFQADDTAEESSAE
jgi:hypothetical protein